MATAAETCAVMWKIRRSKPRIITAEKSTLLRLIAGLTEPTEGNLYLDGTEIKKPSYERGLVFQDPTLFPWLNIYENVAFGLKTRHVFKDKKKDVEEFIKLVKLEGFEKSLPHHLSGGMAQRAGILAATILEPKLLLADEPTSALDIVTQASVVKELLKLRERLKISIILVTHDLKIAKFMADKVLIMKNGLQIEFGTKNQIFNAPQELYTRELLKAADL